MSPNLCYKEWQMGYIDKKKLYLHCTTTTKYKYIKYKQIYSDTFYNFYKYQWAINTHLQLNLLQHTLVIQTFIIITP